MVPTLLVLTMADLVDPSSDVMKTIASMSTVPVMLLFTCGAIIKSVVKQLITEADNGKLSSPAAVRECIAEMRQNDSSNRSLVLIG